MCCVPVDGAYDSRGNRTDETRDGVPYALTYGGLSDQLMAWSVDNTNWLQWNYEYGPNGSVTSMDSHDDSSGTPSASLAFQAGPGGSGSGATETKYRAVGVNGAYYGYFYDASGRRRAKISPMGDLVDEYFYDRLNELILESDSIVKSGVVENQGFTEYVWLGGRPVVAVSSFADSEVRHSDQGCGGWHPCGIHYPVTDHLASLF